LSRQNLIQFQVFIKNSKFIYYLPFTHTEKKVIKMVRILNIYNTFAVWFTYLLKFNIEIWVLKF
jgi:hypothetical protein